MRTVSPGWTKCKIVHLRLLVTFLVCGASVGSQFLLANGCLFVAQVKMDGGGDDQGEDHRDHDSADYRNCQGLQHLRSGPEGECQGKHACHCRQSSHDDG